MYLEFRTTKLKKCYLDQRTRERMWKGALPDRYVEAVNLLKEVGRPSDLRAFRQFEYEELGYDRKDEHSLKLGYRERLIFTVHEEDGALIARIKEVHTTHYGH